MKKLTPEVKIALTAVAAVVLLFLGINFLKGINIFQSSNSYYVKFADIKGLAVSNQVFANGYPVGTVREIKYNYDNNTDVVVRIDVNEGMTIPRGTKAELDVALMGGVTMNLVLGPNPVDIIAPQDTIHGGIFQGAMDKVGAMLPDAQKMLPKIDSILTHLERITGDPALLQTLQNAAVISENLKTTTAHLDKMMASDIPQMMAHLNKTSANAETITNDLAQADLKKTIAEVNGTLTNLQGLSNQLSTVMADVQRKMNTPDNNLGAFLSDRKLYDRMSNTVQSADSLVNDLKANPKRYVHFSLFGRKSK